MQIPNASHIGFGRNSGRDDERATGLPETKQRLNGLLTYVEEMARLTKSAVFSMRSYRALTFLEHQLRDRVGIVEVSGFSRFEITGRGIHEWLDGIVCSRVPTALGRVGLAYFLTERGNIAGEATLANLAPDRVWYGSAAAAEYHDMDWLRGRLPGDGSIRIESLTNSHTTLVVAGPKARDVMQAAAPRGDWSAAAMPWLAVREVFIGQAPAVAMSVSFSGELAYELHIPNAQLLGAYQTLLAAGAGHGMAPFGLYATESMRLEKGYRHWKADLITEFDPFESGLERFVKLDKDFVGKKALLDRRAQGPRKKFVSMVVDFDAAPAHAGDSVLADGRLIGSVTSASWGHRTGKNLAMAFIEPAFAAVGTALEVEILGQACPALVGEECHYDPGFMRPRS